MGWPLHQAIMSLYTFFSEGAYISIVILTNAWPVLTAVLLQQCLHHHVAMFQSCPKAICPHWNGVSWVAYIPAARASTQFVVNTWVHIMGPMMRGSNVVCVVLSQQSSVPQKQCVPSECHSLRYLQTKHLYLRQYLVHYHSCRPLILFITWWIIFNHR